jgi:PAS domain S-box-containing protein
MTKAQIKKLIVFFIAGFTALFALCLYFHVPSSVFKSLMLVVMVALFYLNQEPMVMGICGLFGLIYISVAAYLGYDMQASSEYYIFWILECLLYAGIYGLAYLFCIRLKKFKGISDTYELVVAGTTAGLWKWDDRSIDQQWWSPRYYKLLGFENNEIPATLSNLRDLIHPDDREAAFQVLEDYIAGKRNNLEHEYRIRHKSGEYRWFLGSGEVLFEKDTRKPIMIIGSIVNIDHKKKYEQALAYQAALLGLSPNSIITTDLNFNVQSWNESAEKLYGIKSADAIGRNVDTLFTNSYPYTTDEEVLNHFNEHRAWDGEAHQITNTGRTVYVLSSVRMIDDANGQPMGILAINSDLSQLRLNNELAGAFRMLENTTRYMEQLAHLSANDLKSPITTLQSLLSHLAKANAIKPGHEGTVEMIREIIDQMRSKSISLDAILQLRKNLTSRDYAAEKVPLALVARDVQEMLKVQVQAYEAEVNINIEKGLQVRMHHSFIKTILFNLLSNSLKFRHPGRKPVIDIQATEANGNIKITITDNGSGFNLNRYSGKLFTIFTQFHDGVEGSGVGLHAVKMITDFYHGEVNIESKPGEGTKVSIILPVTV